MSTNASISIQLNKKEKSGKSIYNHWDGYPDFVGVRLLNFYNTEEKVKELIEMGNVSILGECIGSKTNFDGFNSQESNQCLFYGRDRGDEDEKPIDYKGDVSRYEWNYLFKDGKWYVAKYNGRFTKMTIEKSLNKY
jgi:hypothetical protein